ncbi:MAG: MFS transporter [Bacteroidota bacterium]
MLPALSASRPLRLTFVTAMYVAQGVQYGLLIIAIPAYLAAQGASPVAIGGFISAAVLPWTLKLLYAPLMERYTVLAMGRRRPWILAGTLGAALGYAAMTLVPDPLANLGLLTGAMVGGSLFLALQDIATDALTIDVIPLAEQPFANGLMWGGKVLGVAGTSAGGAWLLGAVGLSGTLTVAAGVTLAFLLLPLLVRERPGERLLPWTRGAASPEARALQLDGWRNIGQSLRRVFVLPASLLAATAGFAILLHQGLFDAYGPVFAVQHLGWTATAFSNAKAAGTLVGGLIGMVGGGWLVQWLGRARAVRAAMFVLVIVAVAMALAAPVWRTALVVEAYLLLWLTAQVLAQIAFFAVCMALCWKPVAGVQFSLYMAIGNLGLVAGSAMMGPLVAVLSPPQMFAAMAVVPTVAALVLLRVDVAAHVDRLAALDATLDTCTLGATEAQGVVAERYAPAS